MFMETVLSHIVMNTVDSIANKDIQKVTNYTVVTPMCPHMKDIRKKTKNERVFIKTIECFSYIIVLITIAFLGAVI